MPLRNAESSDIEAMVALSESFRERLSAYSPVFWRKAEASAAAQVGYFKLLLPLDDVIALVDEQDGRVQAFAIARLIPAPPVYDPGGPVCLIDDFVVPDERWAELGPLLLGAIEREAKRRGAVATSVVCAHLDREKRDLLAKQGFATTCEWHVRAL